MEPMDPMEGMSTEERLGYELVRSMEGRLVTDDTFRASERATRDLIKRLELEIDCQRVLTRYARRTWFEVLFWVFLATAHVRDLATSYPHEAWALIFWAGSGDFTGHAPWWVRALGAGWQAVLVIVLAKRSQVPPWLLDRVPFKSMSPMVFRERWPQHVVDRLARVEREGPPPGA